MGLLFHVNVADHVGVLGNELDVLGGLEDLEGEVDVGEARNTGHVAVIHRIQLLALLEILLLLLAGRGEIRDHSIGRIDHEALAGVDAGGGVVRLQAICGRVPGLPNPLDIGFAVSGARGLVVAFCALPLPPGAWPAAGTGANQRAAAAIPAATTRPA